MDLYFTNLDLYFSRTVVQSMHVHDQALTIHGSIFSRIMSITSKLVKYEFLEIYALYDISYLSLS